MRDCLIQLEAQHESYGSALRDHALKNQTTYILRNSFELDSYSLTDDPVIDYAHFAAFEVSAVGFDPSNTRAIVYMGFRCGVHCGNGQIYALDRENDTWRIDSVFRDGPCAWKDRRLLIDVPLVKPRRHPFSVGVPILLKMTDPASVTDRVADGRFEFMSSERMT
jgi:hypothetical protein